jgi:hypothetical protein
MRIEELKRAKNQRPFQPFWIRMADGREIEVTHPDAIAWEGDGAQIVVCIIPGGGWEIIDIILATSIGMQAPQSLVESKKA